MFGHFLGPLMLPLREGLALVQAGELETAEGGERCLRSQRSPSACGPRLRQQRTEDVPRTFKVERPRRFCVPQAKVGKRKDRSLSQNQVKFCFATFSKPLGCIPRSLTKGAGQPLRAEREGGPAGQGLGRLSRLPRCPCLLLRERHWDEG